MATFLEVCFWELSYVNVPTVNLESYSMNVATRYVVPPHLLDGTALLVRTINIHTRYVFPPHLFDDTALLVCTTCTCASFWI